MSFILLVEGSDDLHVTKHVLLANGVSLQIDEQVKDCGGITKLLDEVLPATLNGGSHGAIGVIVDADTNIAARWQMLRHRLGQAGFDVPAEADAAGTIFTTPRVAGVWIMPDNHLPGAVEDFIEQLIPDGDALWPICRNAVAAIPQELRRFASSATLKAELHTYLAWQEEPGTPYGSAIAKRYLSAGGPNAAAFVAWVERLRELSQD